jgi:hypothetical protein
MSKHQHRAMGLLTLEHSSAMHRADFAPYASAIGPRLPSN